MSRGQQLLGNSDFSIYTSNDDANQIPRLLDELDVLAKHGDFSLRSVAAQDRLFLQHDLHLVGTMRSIKELETFLFLTSILLNRLQDRLGSHAVRRDSGLAEECLSGELSCDKFLANLQHLLRSLQHSALEAIIRHYRNTIKAHILHWRLGEGWFAEWPNSHRPLSTTWPWNIKPSLLVLWGVCWMFHGPHGNERRQTRNPRGAANLSEELRTGPPGSQSQPSQQPSMFSRQQ